MKIQSVVAPGVYLMDNNTFRVIARVGDRKTGPAPKEKRFPPKTALRDMKRWQEEARSEIRRETLRPVKGTLAADVPRYLDSMTGHLQHPKHRKHEIEAWLPTLGDRRRDAITSHDVKQQVRVWQAENVAASTIRHRLSALSMLYKDLDFDNLRNPVAGLKRPKEPDPAAGSVQLEHVVKVFDALSDRVKKNGKGWKTLARLSVIAQTGMRHSQVMRLQPTDIHLDEAPPVVYVGQPGKDGHPHWKPLTESGVAAFRMFVEWKAFGPFSQASVYKSWKLACSDADVPFFNPYKLRHTWATTLRAGGLDLADVQVLIGHTSARTTARYAKVAPHKLMGARDALKSAWTRARANVDQERNQVTEPAKPSRQRPQPAKTANS